MLPWFGRRNDRPEEQPERRISLEEPRWDLKHPLAVLKVVGERRTLLGYAENLSRKGMMIGSISPKAVGARYEVEFALPDPEDLVVRCSCRVAWSRPYSKNSQTPGMGLEFLDVSEELAARIESMLWRNGHPTRKASMRIWSEFDHKWIRWRPQAALLRVAPRKEAVASEPKSPRAPGLDPQVSLSCE